MMITRERNQEDRMARRVLGVGAHPDDLEWYAGGTIAKLAREGAEITFVVCTDGERGTYDPTVDAQRLAAQREVEQRNAAQTLGVKEVIFLGYADGEDAPNHFADISDTLDAQMRALERHRSQTTVWDDKARAFIERTARENGKMIGVEYAEAFRRIVIAGALVVADETRDCRGDS
jgi:LmbE family N-acetylglucosaminyl deacetylase